MPGPWRVLIADDDSALCTLIETALRKGPYHVVIRSDAETALAAIDQEEQFDVVISDFMLPGITGIDFVERLRAEERTQDIPIIMISGHTNYGIHGFAKGAGADAFLAKPFTIAQLRAAVAAAIEKTQCDAV